MTQYEEDVVRRGDEDDIRNVFCVHLKDGNGYVSTSELKFVMAKLDVHFTDQV